MCVCNFLLLHSPLCSLYLLSSLRSLHLPPHSVPYTSTPHCIPYTSSPHSIPYTSTPHSIPYTSTLHPTVYVLSNMHFISDCVRMYVYVYHTAVLMLQGATAGTLGAGISWGLYFLMYVSVSHDHHMLLVHVT